MTNRSGSETRQRTHALVTRWSPDEYARLQEIADHMGWSSAKVLRHLMAQGHRRILPSHELIKQVRRLGNNLNQLTTSVNAGQALPGNALNTLYAEMLATLIELKR